jgi:hypothetical protein
MNKKFLSLFILSLSLISPAVNADTIIKFDLGANNDVEFVGGIFQTVNDGVASTPGNQNSDIDFTGFLDASFADILSGASVTISNIVASAEVNVFGTIISQTTNGGSINLWSNTGSLLLSAAFGEGNIAGSIDGVTGSFFNTSSMTYTGGSLLSHVSPTQAGLSLALSGIESGLFPGMTVSYNTSTDTFELDSFRADASGLLSGNPIPEPASMLLLSSAILGGIVSRRKKAV